MNTVAVAQQLARRSTQKDVMRCDADQQSAIIDALNGAVEEFYSIAPSQLRKKKYSYYLQAPATVAMTVASGSKATQAFNADQIGCSILLDGDPIRNEVDGLNLLLSAYRGVDANPSSTLWYDAFPIEDAIDYLTDEPEIFAAQGTGTSATNQRVRLVRDESDYSQGHYFGRILSDFASVAGTPRVYKVEPRAPFASGNPTEVRSVIRVYPPPSEGFELRFEAVVAARQMTIDEIRLGTSVFPVEQRYIRSIIIPLAIDLYASEPYFTPVAPHQLQDIRRDAERARRSIGAITADLAPAHNRQGTPAGF